MKMDDLIPYYENLKKTRTKFETEDPHKLEYLIQLNIFQDILNVDELSWHLSSNYFSTRNSTATSCRIYL